ncbi:CLUMA_CG004094, isoform A [Clunio marinus]|uniref:CLUMA_CG004094, isoform A n=1 Tax=Clunio marinus TaxID=568069 RepID=A0A1J1HQN5_9DIPT|nr:CLUMA_CG004094, isoform A [Clunio marinus]
MRLELFNTNNIINLYHKEEKEEVINQLFLPRISLAISGLMNKTEKTTITTILMPSLKVIKCVVPTNAQVEYFMIHNILQIMYF